MKNNFVYTSLKKANSLLTNITKDKKKLLLVLISFFAFLFIIKNFKSLFITVILIIMGSLSLIHSRYFRYSHHIGVELCILATVLTSLKYGRGIGALTGFLTITSGLILSAKFKPSSFISILVLPLVGLIAPFFNHYPLGFVGIIMTLIYDFIILPLYMLMGSKFLSSLIFFITHVLWNYWIFTIVAPTIFSLM